MSLNASQKKIVSSELYKNYELLNEDKEMILSQLQFTSKQLKDSLEVNSDSSPYDIWKLRDYLEDKLKEQGKNPYPSTVLKENIWFPYKKW